MELLFVVGETFLLEGVGLVLTPGTAPERAALELGAPLFLVRPDGTHVTAVARPISTLVRDGVSPPRPVAVELTKEEVPRGTRVFGRTP